MRFKPTGSDAIVHQLRNSYRDEKLYYQEPPPVWALMESCLGDFGIAPAAPYREIDWIEVSAERADGVAGGLAAVGQFVLQWMPSGLRIVGYTW